MYGRMHSFTTSLLTSWIFIAVLTLSLKLLASIFFAIFSHLPTIRCRHNNPSLKIRAYCCLVCPEQRRVIGTFDGLRFCQDIYFSLSIQRWNLRLDSIKQCGDDVAPSRRCYVHFARRVKHLRQGKDSRVASSALPLQLLNLHPESKFS